MKRWFKKAVAVILTTAMTMSIGVSTAFAAKIEDGSNNVIESQQALSILEKMAGLEQYASYAEDKTIVFDTDRALAAGYDVDVVAQVIKNIDNMNQLVLAGIAVPSDNFTVTAKGVSLKSIGRSDIVWHLDGRVEIFLNSDEAAEVHKFVTKGYSLMAAGAEALKFYSKSLGLKGFANIISDYCIWQTRSFDIAVSNGTGVIVTSIIEPQTGQQFVYFVAQ